MQNDIALIKLREPLDLAEHVQIACLPDYANKNAHKNLTDYLYGFEAGWSSSGSSVSNIMQNTLKFLYNNTMCDSLYTNRDKDWNLQFCAGGQQTIEQTKLKLDFLTLK